MSDKPIIFSGPMVRALLDGRKTQTRRVLKPQPRIEPEIVEPLSDSGPTYWAVFDGDEEAHRVKVPCAPGDRLWVRERFAVSGIGWGKKPRYARGGRVHYHADPDHGWHDYWGKWHPSIHMPRWASRLTLTVTDVRVQRLQEINREDAIAEGIQRIGGGLVRWERWSGAEGQVSMSPEAAFVLLWDSIHGLDAWHANPWVVALTFDVHRCNIAEMAT